VYWQMESHSGCLPSFSNQKERDVAEKGSQEEPNDVAVDDI
jgi:hypothetical protein